MGIASIASAASVGINANRTSFDVPTSLYAVYTVVMTLGIVLSFFLVKPETVRRNDGTKLALFKRNGPMVELKGMIEALKEPRILLLCLSLYVCEAPFAVHSSLNAYTFNARTRTVNNMGYWLIQLPVVYLFGKMCDIKSLRRQQRGWLIIGVCFTVIFAGFIGGEVFLQSADFSVGGTGLGIDWTDAEWGPRFVLWLVWGAGFAIFMATRYWFLAAMTNDPVKLSRYAALTPSLQGAGITTAFGIASSTLPFWAQYTIWFILYALCLPCLIIINYKYVTETNYDKEDDVIAPIVFQHRMGINEKIEEVNGQKVIIKQKITEGNV